MKGTMELLMAIRQGKLEGKSGVRSLLDAGASASEEMRSLGRPLIVAAAEGHVGIMELLVERGAGVDDPVSREDIHPKGWRPLFSAITHEKVGAFRSLIRMGANPNVVQGDDNTTPLMMACEFSLVMVRELLEAGADPAVTDARKKTALHVAGSCKYGSDSIGLLTAKAPVSLLNQLDSDGKTALHYAACFGEEAAVSHLLSAGANDRAMLQKVGETSICTAAFTGHEGVVRIMVATKSNLDAVGGRDILYRPMRVAIAQDRPRILHLLLNAHGEHKEKFWATAPLPLMADRELFSALLGQVGPAPLHVAAAEAVVRSTRLLLAAGADETARGATGHRAGEIIGTSLKAGAMETRKRCEAVARELKRGPAFRARSWTWPACGEGGAGGDRVSGDGAAVLALVGRSDREPLGVRVFRPRRSSGSWCVRRFPRYSLR